MDIMYPLGNGSTWNDNELRYSLRAFQTNLPELRKVFVVGHRPTWLIDNCEFLEHVPFPDTHTQNKDANLFDKIVHVCTHTDIAPFFLRSSDDQVLLRPPTKNELCVRYAYDLADCSSSWWADKKRRWGKWGTRLYRTYGFLIYKDKTTLHCDCHLPQLIERDLVSPALKNIRYDRGLGFCTNTLLMNLVKEKTSVTFRAMKRKKLSIEGAYQDIDKLRSKADGRLWLGYGNKGTNDVLKQYLQEVFPNPSRFERTV